MSDLAKRWAVAGVGVPAVVAILYLGGWFLTLPVAVMAGLGARECFRLADRGGIAPLEWLGVAGAASLVLLAGWRPTFSAFAPPALALVGALTAGALVAALALREPTAKPLPAVAVTLLGVLYVGLPLSIVPLLHRLPEVGGWAGGAPVAWGGLLVVALPLAATWIGDAAALFAGSAWGKGGLAPTISPNKSWVGVWAGVAGAGAAGGIWYLVVAPRLDSLPLAGPLVAVLVGAVLGAAAVVGDLVESLLKREAGVKDSGRFFPGHGGVLDRLDALVFTLPAAYAVLSALDAGS